MQSINVSRYLLPALAVFAMFFILGEAYPNGAPLAACAGAQPIHTTNGSPVQPLNPANNPYSFTLEVEEYIPGQDLEVTIEEANGGMVNGFFLQARRTDTGVPVGSFQDPLPTGTQLRQCTNAADSVTHTNPNGKTGLTFTWLAPAAGMGEVEFVGAVALDHDNFYGGMKSAVLAEGNGMQDSNCPKNCQQNPSPGLMVCGSNGHTYRSPCLFRQHACAVGATGYWYIAYQGACIRRQPVTPKIPCSVRHSADLIITYDPPVSEEDLFNNRIPHDTRVRYACERGYQVNGVTEARCNHGSYGRSSVPRCEPVSCPEPGSDSLSTVESLSIPGIRGYVHGARIRYSCIEGWEIQGIAERECDNGNWTGFPPACRIAARQCPPLQTPNHAVPGPCPPPYTTGKMCTHRCREGYTRTGGNPTRLCNIQSEWTGTPLSCEPEVGIPNNCNPDLQFIETPQNEIHSEGDFVNPKCRVNDEEMIVTWHKDGQKLDLGWTNDIIVDQFNDLYIPSFDSRHEGHYTCVVFAGDDTECLRAEANLTLNPLSFFSHLPEDYYIDMETVGVVTFMCSPADETWEIVWEKDGEPLEDPFTVNGNLVLQDIEEADEGKYTCVVRDPWGPSTGRADAWLFLSDPPLIDISAVCGTITPMLDNTNPTVTPELSSVEEWSSFSMMGQPGDDYGNEARSSRIVGGTTAEFGSAPYMVQISELRDREWTNICGGTLLDQQWVLTAAHCMFEEDTHIPIQNDNMRLLFGEYDTLVQEDSELLRRPAAIIVHEEYRHDERTFDNDIALVRIEPPIRKFTTSIRPICLAPYTLSSRLMRNSVLGRVTGWGRQVSLGPHSRFLKEVAVPFVDRHTCQESVNDDEGVFTENMFCAGYHSAQRDACSGDSGGPLAVRYDDGRWYQLGIVSWGIGCAEEGEYGFYTHVSRFLHWLRAKNVTVAYSSVVGVRFNNSRGSGVLAFTVKSRSNLTVTAGSTVDLECVPNRDDASVEWFIGNSPEPVNMLMDGVRILPSGLVFHFDAIAEEFAGAYSCVARLDDGEGEQVIRADFQIQVTPA